MFEEFKEAVAEADFLFPAKLCEWLFDLEIEASCWVDGHQRVELWKAKEDDPKPEWVSKEEEYMEKKIDALQEAHCELLAHRAGANSW
jgi:hypothetical protein